MPSVTPLENLKGSVFASSTGVLRALNLTLYVILENYLGTPPIQVYMVIEIGMLMMLVPQILTERHRGIFENAVLYDYDVKTQVYMLIRCLLASLSTITLTLAAFYLHSGDMAALYAIILNLMSVVLLFQIPSFYVILLSVPCSAAALILICQPSFIFGKHHGNLSGMGVFFVVISGITRGAGNLIRSHKLREVPDYVLSLMRSTIGSLLGMITVMGWQSIKQIKWKLYGNYSTANCIFFHIIFWTCPFRYALLQWLRVKLFKHGNFFIVTILYITIEIMTCYAIEYWLVGHSANFLSYLGVAFIVLANIPITHYLNKKKQTKEENQGYEPIRGVDSPKSSGELV